MKTIREYQELAAHLASGRSGREAAWRELAAWICPWRGRFENLARDEYERENIARFTHTAVSALLRGASGMTSGMTPRNVAWFKPSFTESALLEAAGARQWLDLLDMRMKDCLAAGGFYQAIQTFNLDLIWAGCSLLYAEAARDTGLRFECCQAGSYYVALDAADQLDCVLRVLRLTPRSMAALFGRGALSEATQAKIVRNPYEAIRVWHCCRKEGEKILSVWWEDNADKFLRQSHYKEMPFFFTRWHEGQSVYGTGPGDDCLADARQMDLLERNKLALLGRLADPPVACPPTLKEVADLAPGGINYVNNGERIEPILDLGPSAAALAHLQNEIANVAQRLEDGLMASIFASPPLDQRPAGLSATEFLERKREMLQRLGPVISAYEPNVLTPILFRCAKTLDRMGLTPPLPDNLANLPIFMKMEFISPMANALRQTSAETARVIFSDVANIYAATQKDEIFDKIDLDQLVDELATGLGAPGSIIRSDEVVAQIRQQRQQALEQQAQLRQAAQQTELATKFMQAQTAANQAQTAADQAL